MKTNTQARTHSQKIALICYLLQHTVTYFDTHSESRLLHFTNLSDWDVTSCMEYSNSKISKHFCIFPLADKSIHVWLLSIAGRWHTYACGEHFIWCRQIIGYTFWNNVTHSRVHTLAAQHKGKYGCILLFSFWSRRLTCSWQEICRQSLHRAKQTHAAATLTDNVFTCATAVFEGIGTHVCVQIHKRSLKM